MFELTTIDVTFFTFSNKTFFFQVHIIHEKEPNRWTNTQCKRKQNHS